jgi:16S rRNA (guanine(527)-N(7))-methyltransferase RsmG
MAISMESEDAVKKIVEKCGLPFDRKIAEKLQKYVFLLKKWNFHINLTASSEWSAIEPLLLEGVWASKIYPSHSKTHLDLGSGAGFPAIPLKILVPHIRLAMIDSRLKRVSFLETVINRLALSDSSVYHGRIENYVDKTDKIWDCVSWKGLKISAGDFFKLKKCTHLKTQFWIFHGRELAAEEPEIIEKSLKLLRREEFPYKSEWKVSVYLPR